MPASWPPPSDPPTALPLHHQHVLRQQVQCTRWLQTMLSVRCERSADAAFQRLEFGANPLCSCTTSYRQSPASPVPKVCRCACSPFHGQPGCTEQCKDSTWHATQCRACQLTSPDDGYPTMLSLSLSLPLSLSIYIYIYIYIYICMHGDEGEGHTVSAP